MPHEQRPNARADARAGQELLSAADIRRITARMAHEVIEHTARSESNAAPVVLGVPTRGVPLAARLGALIAEFSGREVATGALDVTLYRDDLADQPTRPLGATRLPASGVDDAIVVLVDDVLFSGRTVRAALDALRELGRPQSVQLAVLVDRGHRRLPIRADYVGKNVPTSIQESISVRLTEVDGQDGVQLLRPGGQA